MVSALRRTFTLTSLALAALLISRAAAGAMELTSPDLANGANLSPALAHSRCGGANRSPALRWSGAPQGTRSFAVTLFDPDAGGGAGFWHWLVLSIPAGTDSLPEGAGSGQGLPPGATQATNDFGEVGYGGPCPPAGTRHHYELTLYALSTAKLPFVADTKGATLGPWLKSHALAMASLVGTYSGAAIP